ncbi:RAD51-associated protein 2 [Mauremys reevesii]|uniref:RAD51-associated protein 2 n=1 Tax=Mauremys reevesii TaxID=260615 RepID=UPI00193F518C|nr:RAD51-associated protein 2 [Mauremys reevesii]XP_039387632.1 RAD51-associated protein 2 [Mauremys reevesii]XP_039387633.1 RAD51-associated protein 2 [Mauremys reevesii]XP_039387634.1 RAD51-associated protein 2 [Mauremys reevesii]
MKGLSYQTFLSMSSNEADGYPYPKRIKIENNHTSVEKEEQQQLEQRTFLVDECRKSSNKPIYLSEGSLHFSQNACRLEKEISGRERKTSMCEFIDFKPWINEKLQCRLLENKLFTKKWNIENEEHSIIRDDSLLNVNGHSSEEGLYQTWNVNKNSKNIAENNKTDNDNELKLNASLSSVNTDLFQVKTSSQKIGTDNKWKKHQLLDVPFLCGINSTFSEIKNNDRNNCLKKLPTEENKDHYGNESESVEQLGNKEKNASPHTFPTLKLFKNIQTFKIPQTIFFMKGNISKCSNASNTLNSNISTNLKELEQKNFKHQTYVMQSAKIYCSQNISMIRKQKFQNDKNIVNAASVCSEFNKSNHQSVSKQKTLALAEEEEKITENNLRNNMNSVKCNQMFAKRIVKEKELGNEEGNEDQEPNIYLSVHTYFGSKTTQSDECSNPTNILKRTWGKVSYEDVTFNIQETTIPLISEVLRNRDLNINYDMHCANCNRNLHESELKLSTTKILDIKRYLSKTVVTKGNCPYSTTQDLPDTRDIDKILKRKKLTEPKIFFHDMLLGSLRTRPGSLNEEVLKHQEDDSIIGWFHLYEKLKSVEQYSIPELITSINNNSTHIYLQVTVSEQQNVNTIKSNLAFFPYNINCLHPAEEKCIPVEKNPFYCRKQVKRNSHINNNLEGNTKSQQKYITYPGMCKEIINPKLVKNVGFQLHHKYQKIHYSSTVTEHKEASFLHKRALFHNQQRAPPEGRCAKQYCLLSRGSTGMHSIISMFDSEEKDSKRQLLVANGLLLPRDNFDSSFLWKRNWCSTKKILTETNLGLLNYLPSISKMKFEKLNNKCSNLQMLVATIKHKKKKQRKIHNIAFPKEKFKTLHSVLSENIKNRSRRITNSVNFAHEATNLIPKYLRTANKENSDKKGYANCRQLQKNCCSSLPKIPFFSIFDTYEKIPLSTDSEEMEQIPLVRQINPNNEKYIEESTVASIKSVHNVPAKSDVCILPELSTIVNCNSELLPDSRNSQHLENERKYVHFLNTGLNYGNIFHCFLDNGQCSTSPFYCGSFTDKDVVLKTEEGHCRSFLSDDTEKLCEEMNSILQSQIVRSSEVSYNNNMYFKVHREETMTFSLDEDIQKDRNFCTLNSKPMTIKQNLEDLQEVGEISSGKNYITNKNQLQTILHGSRSTNLILSYSEDESAICVASGDKLIPHLSIMDNGCIEDMTDQHLPSESKNISEFEMKSKFDLVLEELCMFHEISKEHENKLSKVETNTIQENPQELNNSEGVDENLKSVSQTKVCISFPICGTTAGQNITKNNQSSFKGKILSRNVKQKVPHEFCSSSMSDEELLYALSEEDYVDSGCKNRFPWDPVFLSHTFMKERRDSLQKERGNYLSHEIIRVQPLKTCSGPIRIGLSRKAKPKKLHPYLK